MEDKKLLDLIIEYGNACFECGAFDFVDNRPITVNEYEKLHEACTLSMKRLTEYIDSIIEAAK